MPIWRATSAGVRRRSLRLERQLERDRNRFLLPKAKKALKKFPSIGDPGAEKILLFTRSHPVMALDSNGLRVLCRVGFAEEQKNYPATYRLVQNAIREQLPQDYDSLIRAHQLLRQHGQELCKRSKPRCAECPVRTECAYNRNAALSQ